jgi:type II secretory pathway component PulJ
LAAGTAAPQNPLRRSAAFTLVEIMVALALSLLLLAAVISMFGKVSEGIGDSRSLLEMADRLRLAEERLQLDLAGVTVTMNPPANPANNPGYFEYIEGPATTGTGVSSNIAVNNDTGNTDQTVGDFDDILMFTTRSSSQPFVGKYPAGTNGVGTSTVAEVAWFVRGHTLHRRVLLVMPGANLSAVTTPTGYYANNDISARWNSTTNKMVPNTLASLTDRKYRFAHPNYSRDYWLWTYKGDPNNRQFPTLPTLNECSASNWSTEQYGGTATLTWATSGASSPDFWTNVPGHCVADNALMTGGTRVSDDIILNNVIGFDVKGWDPVRKMYVDLGDTGTGNGLGHYGNSLQGGTATAKIYDTWSTSYFYMDKKGNFSDIASNGLDDDGNGVIDDDGEKFNPVPYPVPLRGIQVKIRVFEPDSKQIREVTVVQDFLPQ